MNVPYAGMKKFIVPAFLKKKKPVMFLLMNMIGVLNKNGESAT